MVDSLVRMPLCGKPFGKGRIIVKSHHVWVQGRVPQRPSLRPRPRQCQGQQWERVLQTLVVGTVLHV